MALWSVEAVETVVISDTVEAGSREEALAKVKEMYYAGELEDADVDDRVDFSAEPAGRF